MSIIQSVRDLIATYAGIEADTADIKGLIDIRIKLTGYYAVLSTAMLQSKESFDELSHDFDFVKTELEAKSEGANAAKRKRWVMVHDEYTLAKSCLSAARREYDLHREVLNEVKQTLQTLNQHISYARREMEYDRFTSQ